MMYMVTMAQSGGWGVCYIVLLMRQCGQDVDNVVTMVMTSSQSPMATSTDTPTTTDEVDDNGIVGLPAIPIPNPQAAEE